MSMLFFMSLLDIKLSCLFRVQLIFDCLIHAILMNQYVLNIEFARNEYLIAIAVLEHVIGGSLYVIRMLINFLGTIQTSPEILPKSLDFGMLRFLNFRALWSS